MTTDLDGRAREAAAALQRAARDVARPEFEPQWRRRTIRPGRWLAVGATVAAAGVAVVAVVAVSDDADDPPGTATGVVALIPEAVPDGLEPTGAVDLPLPGSDRGPERLTVTLFGDPNTADPAGGAHLGVTVFRSQGVSPAGGGQQLTVRGLPALVSVDGAGRTALMWQEVPGVLVLVSSDTVGQDELVAVAGGLTFSADYAQVGASVLPPRFAPVGTLTDGGLTGTLAPSVLSDTTPGHMVGYRDPEDGRVLIVATFAVGRDELPVIAWMLGRPTGELDVRGHPATVSTQDGGTPTGATLRTIMWEESPGVFAVVAGSVDDTALEAAARSLRPASEQEWSDIEALGHTVGPTASPNE